jgi:hypothetical protein
MPISSKSPELGSGMLTGVGLMESSIPLLTMVKMTFSFEGRLDGFAE